MEQIQIFAFTHLKTVKNEKQNTITVFKLLKTHMVIWGLAWSLHIFLTLSPPKKYSKKQSVCCAGSSRDIENNFITKTALNFILNSCTPPALS